MNKNQENRKEAGARNHSNNVYLQGPPSGEEKKMKSNYQELKDKLIINKIPLKLHSNKNQHNCINDTSKDANK